MPARLLPKDRALCGVLAALVCILFCPWPAAAQQRREREPNSVYAARRAKLAAQVDGPVVLWGLTGREESSQSYVFTQEDNFYYLTGHNEEEAALVILPAKAAGGNAASEMLFLPEKNPQKEKWNGARMAPTDPGIQAATGFATVKAFPELRATVETLAKSYASFYTILPYDKELGGYPHEKAVVDWLHDVAPRSNLKDIRTQIEGLRQIKAPTEVAFLQTAVDLSDEGHLAAMKMMRPGLYEYQVAAKMVEVHAMGGSEAEGYAPIVGAGPNSTSLHYDKLSRKIQDGDIVVLDVAAQFSGYSADITRTLPANGKFTQRQREIYEIVLGAQNAAIAALTPGMSMCNRGGNSLYRIAYDYINSHGKDLHGRPLGQYFIHGLGHNIGLDVHDPGASCEPLKPGQVITIEPGIYIPEENLGVRIEDDFLVTETGHKFLSERLPRDAEQIEKIMAEAGQQRSSNSESGGASEDSERDKAEISAQLANYAKSIDTLDLNLASQVWWNSPEASFIHPLGHEHGFEQIKQDVYEKIMGGYFSERHLSPHDAVIHVYGDSAVVEFYWDFNAKMKKDGSPVTTHGRESQVYERKDGGWKLVHVHYSGLASAPSQGF